MPFSAHRTELQMIDGRSGHDFLRTTVQILNRHVLNILPEELLGMCKTAEGLGFASRGDDSIHD